MKRIQYKHRNNQRQGRLAGYTNKGTENMLWEQRRGRDKETSFPEKVTFELSLKGK